MYENDKFKIVCESNFNGKELKDLIISEKGWDSNSKMRLLYGGAEVKEDKQLFQYKIQKDYIIQLLKT